MAAGGSCPWAAAGGKKDLSGDIAAAYDPKEVEKDWYDWWENSGFFRPRSDFEGPWDAEKREQRGQFVICLPPPNVTGYLHLGHALTAAVQDTVIRWRRMRGENTLWIPGTDHAGIATQVVTEKKLMREEGKSRHDLGREKFLEKVWEVKRAHGDHIKKQFRLTGASLDWTRTFFTMDDVRAKAVTEAFVRMYDSGIIRRSTRLINWSCDLQSCISDLEVEYVDCTGKGQGDKATGERLHVPGYDKTIEVGLMYHFHYIVAGSGEKLEVATTRPETILGDTAVAIHPEDDRYKHLHGKKVKCPFRDEEIPLVCDDKLVDKDFGTGVVKVTPAHDPNDFECGLRHNLPQLTMLDKRGKICLPGCEFHGMKRFDARKAVVEALKKKGQLVTVKGHAMRIGICSRSKDIIEPLLMPQWFVECGDMARRSLEAERTQQLRLIPETPNAKIWANWLENIRPWCISRQLWWGHRIPAYEASLDGKPVSTDPAKCWFVGRDEAEVRARMQQELGLSAKDAARVKLEQDPDVLDTWFSSGLLPHSALGWPNEEHPDFKQFFPTDLLETGHDILFFWVARMVMTSFQFCDKVPFHTCYLHAMVRDKDGQKMSKSKGNVIDPLDMVYGIKLEDMHRKLVGGNLDQKEVENAIKGQVKMFPKTEKRPDGGLPECGSDALKFGLLSYTSSSSRSVNLDTERVVNYRYFCNKLWNAIRYGLYHSLGKDYQPPETMLEAPLLCPDGQPFRPWKENQMVDERTRILRTRCTGTRQVRDGEPIKLPPFACQWILSRLDSAVIATNAAMHAYNFGDAVQAIYSFWYDDFCDWMIEMCKAIFRKPPVACPHILAEKETFKHVLWICLETGLRLLHPMMPYVTEELWNRLPGRKAVPSVMVAAYPTASGWANPRVEERFRLIQDVTRAVRSMKAQYQLADKDRPDVFVTCKREADQRLLEEEKTWIIQAGYSGRVAVARQGERFDGCITWVVNHDVQVHMHLRGMIKPEEEIKKLEKKRAILQKSLDGLLKKMELPSYESKVPENIRLENAEKAGNLKVELTHLHEIIHELAAMA